MDAATKKILAEVIQGVLEAENAAHYAYLTADHSYKALLSTVPDFVGKYEEIADSYHNSRQHEHDALQDRLGRLLEQLQRPPRK